MSADSEMSVDEATRADEHDAPDEHDAGRDDVTAVGATGGDPVEPASGLDPIGEVGTERDRVDRMIVQVLSSVLLVMTAVVFWHAFHIDGHNPGDDFALYVNQARSLLQGDIGETIAANRFTVDNSAWQTFSPYAYPWGLPLLLAPVMVLTGSVDPVGGVDYGPLKLVISATLAVALLAYFHVSRRRVHVLGAIALPLFFATSYWYVLHTDQVLSELPFLMWVMLFVVWLDRVRERGLLLGGSRWHLVVLGLLGCAAFNTRREGLGLMVGLLAAHLVAIAIATGDGSFRARARRIPSIGWKAIATPWITFVVSSAVVQLVLPSDFLPKYTERDPAADTGLHRIPDNIRIYRPLFAEQLGLKDPGPQNIEAFHSTALGEIVMYSILGFALLGIVISLVTRASRDAGLVGTAVGLAVAVLSAPFQDYRYLLALLPFVLLFAFIGLERLIRAALPLRPNWPTLAAEAAVVAMILGGLPDTRDAYEYRSNWIGVQAGPQEPHTLEMWQAVRRETRGDSVIVFSRARMMGLYTRRVAVQGGAIDFIERSGDYYVMYLDPDGSPGSYSQYPLDDDEASERGFTEIWRNNRWVIYRTPTARLGP